ncbi:DUF6471 domain-containing protein [Citrifermentans bremense]|uniref:DUF6471 domain-containing protein n=1 Tax=Citrifermentans bremense TaxID=60035 RepID=UPI00047E7F98|nr:DUF6471 domain-containing protein [Citrifermentans bremense]
MATDRSNKLTPEAEFNAKAKGILKAELALRGIGHQELADRLSSSGLETTKASVDCKLSRGSFGAGFFLQCLRVIGCEKIEINSIGKLEGV